MLMNIDFTSTQSFTESIEKHLALEGLPEVMKELVVQDLAKLILERVSVDFVQTLSEEDAAYFLKLGEEGNFEELFTLFSQDEEKNRLITNSANCVMDEFVKHMEGAL